MHPLADLINEELYFTVKHFALATNRSEQNVRFLMCYGNRIRKLKVTRIADKPMIPYSELMEFPFTVAGRNSDTIFHYTEDGQISEEQHAV